MAMVAAVELCIVVCGAVTDTMPAAAVAAAAYAVGIALAWRILRRGRRAEQDAIASEAERTLFVAERPES